MIHQGPVQMLEGIKVLDLSRVLAGPWATQMLADFGASVLKIEKPVTGDDTRQWGPPWHPSGLSTYFSCANRGKVSATVDFNNAEQLTAVHELLEQVDVVVENFKVGHLKKFGLDSETLRSKWPRLIYCSITGYGQNGPRAMEAGYDFALQGLTGLMSVTGPENGQPFKVGVAVIDIVTGIYACNAITAALYQRQATGRGAYIDCSLFDTGIALLANQASAHVLAGTSPKALGNTHPSIVPYQAYKVNDGFFIVAVGNDQQFRVLTQTLGQSHLGEDSRFSTNPSRVKNREALNALIAPLFEKYKRSELERLLAPLGIPCAPVQTIDEVFKDPQLAARQLLTDHPSAKGQPQLKTIGQPMVINGLRPSHSLPPPELGNPIINSRCF